MKIIYKYSFTFIFLLLAMVHTYASHIRAGEITAEKNGSSPLNYRFTLTLYFDIGGFDQTDAELDFGDGQTQSVSRSSSVNIGNQTTRNIFYFTHTYSAADNFVVSFVGENRNAGVINMGSSVTTPFAIQTTIFISPLAGLNNTPILQIAPIDLAAVGQRFEHNPGAYDLDGDSIAFEMYTPQRANGVFVNGYSSPITWSTQSEAGGAPEFYIDPVTGDLVWDSPNTIGEYNIAFKVKEFRDGELMSVIIRDMQIKVLDAINIRPKITLTDICVKAGETVNQTITVSDPNGDPVKLTSYGEPYNNVDPAFASFSNSGVLQNSPGTSVFNWQTNCSHVRKEPYQVIVKAEDKPAQTDRPPLVDFANMNVRVIGPEPINLTANINGTNVDLNWSSYVCQNAVKMTVWRHDGPSGYTPGYCETGLPASLGFVKVGEVAIGTTSFTDNNNGRGIELGRIYCYRIFALFPETDGSESVVSAEVCVSLPLTLPIFTNITVDSTSTTNGVITIKWTTPRELDTTTCKGPYKYELYRNEGLTGSAANTLVYSTNSLTDTVFTDRFLNTKELAYNYEIAFSCSNTSAQKTPNKASSVLLTSEGSSAKVLLTWEADVPWNNKNQYHKIYRNINGVFTLIDSVFVTTDKGEYTDKGTYNNIPLEDSVEYCYYVQTKGTYNNPQIISPLYNNSQIRCEIPLDSIPPCPPALALDSIDCDQLIQNPDTRLINTLSWLNQPYSAECDSDIVSYNIYYNVQNTSAQKDFVKISAVTDTFFVYENPATLAGCFAVTAVDKYGNESDFSNIVCVDNCTYYDLPNVFTPNGDGPNDLFFPLPVPRFVKSVKFTVYNRWGNKIMYIDNDINLNWNGKSDANKDLPEGIYYYIADVEFNVLRETNRSKTIKGWIQILR